MYSRFLKPLFDFIIALLLLIVLVPALLLITLLLLITGVNKPFFLQKRSGYRSKTFVIIKFRTMTDEKDRLGNLLPDKDRLTFIGKLIRKTSIDEIPQLVNVIKGDMSLVGPRPLLLRYLPYYSKEENVRHNVKPGITGLAQVKGRNTLGWDHRLALDIEYVNNMSLNQDIIIFIKSIKIVLFSKGGYIDPQSIMNDLDIERKDRVPI